jgi:uncharacterized protein involved in response to NO
MLFGFTLAVIAGFLLTAGSNWTGRETASGYGLLGLVALWFVGRIAFLIRDPVAYGLVFALDGGFVPVLMVAVGRAVVGAKSRRNYLFLVLLGGIAGSNAIFHLGALGVVDDGMRRGSLLALDIVVLMIVVISGRIIPMFTRNRLGDDSIRSFPTLDFMAIGATSTLILVDLFATPAVLRTFATALAAVFTFARATSWGSFKARKDPLLWVLHAGYFWIPVGLLARAAMPLAPALAPAATHSLTVGAVGTLTLGMMARVTLGHTGRMLHASRVTVLAFLSITAAALVRTLGAVGPSAYYRTALLVSGVLWTLSFAIYVWVYAPMLFKPRVDGRAG